MTTTDSSANEAAPAPRWKPLSAIQRRILGVLVEKAKTTPENYPLSLNALRTGANQKSNRSPLTQYEEDQLEEALEELRRIGAVAQIQGGARIDRYRHLAYEWLGVDKVELAVMGELLLRGAQTVGELRGRAARMEPIADLAALRPILDSLHAKRLILYLTPPGRGAVVTHALYEDRELEKVKRETATWASVSSSDGGSQDDAPSPAPRHSAPASAAPPAAASPASRSGANDAPGSSTSRLSEELHQLREEVAAVKQEFQAARSELEATAAQLRQELDELNRQLGN